MLDSDYHSSLLLHNCLISSVKSEKVYKPILNSTSSTDPHDLHTPFHQVIKKTFHDESDTRTSTPSRTTPSPICFSEEQVFTYPNNANDFEIFILKMATLYLKEEL